MNIQRIPLAERIRLCQTGQTSYPEYIPSAILRLAEMPVMDYLIGIDPEQQRRFSQLAGLRREDAAYQWAALRVAELPAPLRAEAMRILAEPMVRYAAMSDRDSLPPLRYPPAPPRRPAPGERLSLAKRLRQAVYGSGDAPCLPIYRLRTDAYFYNLDLILGGSAYGDMLEILLGPSFHRFEAIPWLPQFVSGSRELPEADQARLLYQALVRPFAELEKERMKKTCEALPF